MRQLRNSTDTDLTLEEQAICEALLEARCVQEFLWQNDPANPARVFEAINWVELFQKRVDKIAEIKSIEGSGIVELRKRVLQQAALSCFMLAKLTAIQMQNVDEPKWISASTPPPAMNDLGESDFVLGLEDISETPTIYWYNHNTTHWIVAHYSSPNTPRRVVKWKHII